MPEQPGQAVPGEGDRPSDAERDDVADAESESAAGAEAAAAADAEAEPDDATRRRARLDAAKRRYRATLRNEADSGGGGFSEDYYRSQKPPHWS